AIDGALLDALLARQQMIKLIPAAGSVSSVAFSPDGRWIASAESPPAATKSTAYLIRLLDAGSGKPIGTTFAGHTFGISALLFNGDASRLFSASFDETMRLWNTMTGQTIGSPRDAGARGVNAIAINPSGTLLVSAHADETIHFWNPENLEPIGLPRE